MKKARKKYHRHEQNKKDNIHKKHNERSWRNQNKTAEFIPQLH